MPHAWVTPLVRLYALLLLAVGFALLFAPELAAAPTADARTLLLAQVVAAACLGLGTATWTARGSLLGGIYGRAVVVGNQTFAFVSALVLTRAALDAPGPALWAALAVVGFGAVLFSILLYRPPRPPGA